MRLQAEKRTWSLPSRSTQSNEGSRQPTAAAALGGRAPDPAQRDAQGRQGAQAAAQPGLGQPEVRGARPRREAAMCPGEGWGDLTKAERGDEFLSS